MSVIAVMVIVGCSYVLKLGISKSNKVYKEVIKGVFDWVVGDLEKVVKYEKYLGVFLGRVEDLIINNDVDYFIN